MEWKTARLQFSFWVWEENTLAMPRSSAFVLLFFVCPGLWGVVGFAGRPGLFVPAAPGPQSPHAGHVGGEPILVVFFFLRGSLKKVFTFSDPSKDFHGLSAQFRRFRFNILLSHFWLITGVRTVPVAAAVADHSGGGAVQRQQ